MSAKSIAAALTAREQDRAFRESQAIGGVAPGTVGPVAPPVETSPEQQAAVALARARFQAQEIANYQLPRPGEESGVSKFAASGIGKALLPKPINRRNAVALSGVPEQKRLEGRFDATVQGLNLAKEGLALSDRQRGLDEERERREITKGGLSTPEGIARTIVKVGQEFGDTGIMAQGLRSMGDAQQYREQAMSVTRKESSRKMLDAGLSALKESGRDADPRSLLHLTLSVATKTGDYGAVGEIASRFSGIQENEDQAHDRSMRLSLLARQNQKEDAGTVADMTRGALDLMGKIQGLGIDEAMGSVMLMQGKELPEGMGDAFRESMEQLREPLRRMAQIQEKLQAKKLGEDQVAQRKALQDEFNNYYDSKTGKPIGWLKKNYKQPAKDGLTIGQMFDQYFLDRQNEFLGGGGEAPDAFDMSGFSKQAKDPRQSAPTPTIPGPSPPGAEALGPGLIDLMYGDR